MPSPTLRVNQRFIAFFLALFLILSQARATYASELKLRLATFQVDATPEVGSPLAYDPMVKVSDRLSCKGIVLLPADQQPIVLCTVDWIGIGNSSNAKFCKTIAEAAETSADRVVVHTLHQHDAPRCDHSAIELLAPYKISDKHYDLPFIDQTIKRAASAVKESLSSAQAVDNIQFGEAEVRDVASNRRMLDSSGRVAVTRYTACKSEEIRNLPVGVIDPLLRLLSFEGTDGPLACMTFYATHPQSYYRVGAATPDFPGLARDAQEKATGVFHVHFNGAGGNIGAGKYNDGSHENRAVLADRVQAGMSAAWAAREPSPASQISWDQLALSLPVSEAIDLVELNSTIRDEEAATSARCHAAEKLAFALRMQAGETVPVSRLAFGECMMMFMPGELFVEYQLAAQAMRPDTNVMMAAYGDYGTQYIGTRVAYPQGGYEVSPSATNVSPAVERVLLDAMEKLLRPSVSGITASDFTDRTGPGLPPK
ncbi:MAG: hypothetical protein Aurels2KO_35060 [Aureliella sp.]